jgi:D-serine deaminase-like pyridoxal phosphate-dependent protein
MDFSLQNHRDLIGRGISDLPTPSLILSKRVMENNVRKLHNDVAQLGISFRPHVKTLKVFTTPPRHGG